MTKQEQLKEIMTLYGLEFKELTNCIRSIETIVHKTSCLSILSSANTIKLIDDKTYLKLSMIIYNTKNLTIRG